MQISLIIYTLDLIHQTQRYLSFGLLQEQLDSGTAFTPFTTAQGLWGLMHKDTTFSAIGNVTYTLGGGEDYQAGVPALGGNGGMRADIR